MNIVISGSGAMGCRFGVAFKQAGADVCLYDGWKDHVAAINENGLQIWDGEKTEPLTITAVTDLAQVPTADVLVIFTKAMNTAMAVQNALPVIGENTVFLTLQNGIGNIEAIKSVCPDNAVVAGVTNYAADLMGPGKVELKGSGITKMMALEEKAKPVAEEMVRLLASVGHNAEVSEDVLVDIWEKVAFNAGMNTISCVTGLSVSGMGKTEPCRNLLFNIASEVVKVANAEGVKASEKHVHETILSVFDPKMSGDHKTSMLQDRLSERQTEIESICGEVIRKAEKYGIDVPNVRAVYALVIAIQSNYGKCYLHG